jgi:hypothetical protein
MNNKTQDEEFTERKCANCGVTFNPISPDTQYACSNCEQASNRQWEEQKKQRWKQSRHYKQVTRKKISLSFPVQFLLGFFGWFICISIYWVVTSTIFFHPDFFGFFVLLSAVILPPVTLVVIMINIIHAERKSMRPPGIALGIIAAIVINMVGGFVSGFFTFEDLQDGFDFLVMLFFPFFLDI